jgi:triosephosphate isomerase
MKHIYVNFKRFDVPAAFGGVNRGAGMADWAGSILRETRQGLSGYAEDTCRFTMFFPEAHLLSAAPEKKKGHPAVIGCQGVYREDCSPGINFGAFTANRPAAAAKALGCGAVLIGHCEERRDKADILAEAGVSDSDAVNRILAREIKAAVNRGMDVLYCIGEPAEEHEDWRGVLKSQLEIGLHDVDTARIIIAYEPVWAIGPGKTPPGREYIQEAAAYIKEVSGGLPVVYGGGLKEDNAKMLASVPEVDGGLIALTRFSGDIGFYPEEFLSIVRLYLEG